MPRLNCFNAKNYQRTSAPDKVLPTAAVAKLDAFPYLFRL